MKFKLSTTGNFYRKEEAEKLEKLGFTFKKEESYYQISESEVEVEINTLEELIRFSDEWGDLIISRGSLEIYDDYGE